MRCIRRPSGCLDGRTSPRPGDPRRELAGFACQSWGRGSRRTVYPNEGCRGGPMVGIGVREPVRRHEPSWALPPHAVEMPFYPERVEQVVTESGGTAYYQIGEELVGMPGLAPSPQLSDYVRTLENWREPIVIIESNSRAV